ncbi:MAG: hypothetical protein E7562_00270 [Ruminococcaceae bacterium]|nr:hypothetical protein [Oscillospiraceae bacterium]
MGFVLDIIILAIVFIIVLLSARKGFVRTAIEVVGFVAAIVLAFTISQPLADITYEKIVEEPMISAAEDNAENLTEKVWDALPGFVADNAETFGISKADVDDTIGSNAQKGSEAAVKQVSATVVKPAATRLLSGIYCSILFIVLMIVVKLLAKVVNKLFSFSFIGTINKALGGVVGVVKGALYAFVFVTVTVLIASLNQGSFLIFTDEAIDSSFVYRLLAELSSLYPFK